MADPSYNVVRIIDRLNVGGPAIHVTLLSRYLDALPSESEPWKTLLIYGQEEPQEGHMKHLLTQGAPVTTVFLPGLGRELHPVRDLSSLWQVVRVLRQVKPKVVHTHKSKAGAIGRIAAWLSGVPIRIHTYHGHVLHGYFSPLKSRIFIWIERTLALLSHTLIAVSPKVKEDLVRYRIAPPEKIQVLYLGLELARFAEKPRGGGTLREELGLSNEQPIVGLVARLVPIKGPSIFLEAAAQIAASDPAVHFVIAGDGELRGDLEKLASRLGIYERVHFLGFRSDLENIYPDIDVLTLTSANEGSPVSLIEGLASGCAVVSTRVGGVPDVVKEGETGRLITGTPQRAPAETAQELAQEVLSLLKNPAERKRLGENGRKDVLNRFDISRLVSDIHGLYSHALQEKVL